MEVDRSGSIAMALCAVTLLAGCWAEPTPREEASRPPATVEAITLRAVPFEEVAEFTGALTAAESVVVRPESSGVIETIEFREGQTVEKGQLLFRLRDAEQRARLAEARAARDLAERVFRRVESLEGSDVLSTEELDQARSALAQANARVEIAEVEFERTRIRAPFDGVLGPRMVSPGDRVTGGSMSGRDDQTGLVQIDAIEELKLNFTLPEVAVNAVQAGIPVEISVAPFPGERFPGELYFIAPSLDPRNRRLLVKARIPNEDHRLRAGLSCNVFLPMGERQGVLLAPTSAIVRDVAGTFVWKVADDGTAERRTVELGARRPGLVELTSGVRAGDRVVSAGTNKVSAGQPLDLVPAADLAGLAP
jgi:membrane fusion protein (multidrug efflux system)